MTTIHELDQALHLVLVCRWNGITLHEDPAGEFELEKMNGERVALIRPEASWIRLALRLEGRGAQFRILMELQ